MSTAGAGSEGMHQAPLWQKAASFGAERHAHQKRWDGRTPYFAHPARVALTLANLFGCRDEQALAMALLHDVIEDTGCEYDEILEEFGKVVAEGVAALSMNNALPESARAAENLQRLAEADWRVRLVKLADVYDNLCDLPGAAAGPAALARRKRAVAKTKAVLELVTGDVAKHAEIRDGVAAIAEVMNRLPA